MHRLDEVPAPSLIVVVIDASNLQRNLYYATQVNTAPPTFMIFANATIAKGSAFRRYLENVVRRELDLRGVPARLVIRKR